MLPMAPLATTDRTTRKPQPLEYPACWRCSNTHAYTSQAGAIPHEAGVQQMHASIIQQTKMGLSRLRAQVEPVESLQYEPHYQQLEVLLASNCLPCKAHDACRINSAAPS